MTVEPNISTYDEFVQKAIEKTLDQGQAAVDSVTGVCVYFDPQTSLSCAIGCMVDPNDALKFDPHGEGVAVDEPVVLSYLKESYPSIDFSVDYVIADMGEFQRCHDYCSDNNDFSVEYISRLKQAGFIGEGGEYTTFEWRAKYIHNDAEEEIS